jgi:DNA-binding FadR family transcriptional regulator
MAVPGTFERVYSAIRDRLREGRYRPGERIEPALLSDELNASVTPVRDALHRLTGERLVEAPPHEGFRAPMMTETLLRYLYSWHLDLLLLVLMKQRASALSADVAPDGRPNLSGYRVQNAVFAELARATGNPEHVAALKSIAERLEPVQRLEQLFLDGTETETGEILRSLHGHDRKALRSGLIRYHRRRLQIVPKLLEALLES